MIFKKGEMGISSMLILIASILIVSLIMGMFLFSSHELESKANSNLKKIESHITNKPTIFEPRSTYNSEGNLQNFTLLIKSGKGQEGIDISSFKINFKTNKEITTLSYKDGENSLGYNGFYTFGVESYNVPSSLNEDVDEDGLQDSLVWDGNYVNLVLSGDSDIELGECSGVDTFSSTLSQNDYINSVEGVCSGSVVQEVTLDYSKKGQGYFTYEFISRSNENVEGMIYEGDLVKLYFESQFPLGTEVTTTIIGIPKTGISSQLMFVTPDMPSIGQISLSHY